MHNNPAGSSTLTGEIAALAPWFHNIHLPDGQQTAPGHYFGDFPSFKWEEIKICIPDNLQGWTALDIGCNAGFYSFEMAKRGANVLGIDLDPHYLQQANWVAEKMGLSHCVSFRQMQVYDLIKLDQKFDLIIFMGVLYHLRYPLLALDIVSSKLNKMMIFQTLTMPGEEVYDTKPEMELDDRPEMLQPGWPVMAFIEKRLAKDPTNWWAPNHACIEAMLRTCGLKITTRPGHEMYIAERDESLAAVASTWNRSEYLSATGQQWLDSLEAKVRRGE
ncbi:MAG: TIGR04290 family methyltransferase [Bacteroidota bacterium]